MAGKSGAIRAGRSFVELFADKSKLVRGLRGASASLKAWGASTAAIGGKVAGVGAAMTAPFLALAKVSADVGGQLIDASAKTGVSVEALSTLGYAAKLAGVDSEQLTGGLNKMQKTLFDAAGGSEAAQKALGAVGLTVEGLAGLKPDEQFKAIAEGLSRVTDPAQRTALAMKLFGKSGVDLLPMLSGGAAGLDAMQAEARRLGVEISTADAAAGDQLGDTLDTLTTQFTAIAVRVSAAVLPAIQWFAEAVRELAVRSATWISENKGLIQTVFMVAAGLTVAGGVVAALGFAISVIGAVVGVFATGLSMVGGLIGAILSPIGLLTAGVLGLGAYMVYASDAGGKAMEWLGGAFDTVAGDAATAWGGIKSAIAAGDLGAAAAVGLGFLKLEFTRALGFLSTKWAEFSAWIQNIGADVWHGVAVTMSDAYAGFESYLAGSFPQLYEIWTTFTTWLSNTWTKAMGWLAEKYSEAVQAITGQDQTAGIEGIRRETQSQIDANNAESQRRLALDQEGRMADIENRRQGRAAGFAKDNADSKSRNEADRDAAIKAAEKGLQAAQKEFADTVGKATATTNADAGGRPGLAAFDPARAGFDPAKVQAGLGAGVVDAKAKTAGTFSGALAGQIVGGGDVNRKIANATEGTRKAVERLITTVENGGAAFA